jgi:hypothetical protein
LCTAVAALAVVGTQPAGAAMSSNKIGDDSWVVGQHVFDAALRVDDTDACHWSTLGVEVQQWGGQNSAAPSDKIFLYNQQGPTAAAGCDPVHQYDLFSSDGGPLVELPPSALDVSPTGDTVHVVAVVDTTDVTFGSGTASFHVDLTFHSRASAGDGVATVTGTVSRAGRTWTMDSVPWGTSWEQFGNGAPFAWTGQTVNSPYGVVQTGNRHSLFDDYRATFGHG